MFSDGLETISEQGSRIPVHNNDAESHGGFEFTVKNFPPIFTGVEPPQFISGILYRLRFRPYT